jgi:ribosome-associated toxin RatA of RatAB toxin-antitoxin module
MHESTLRAAEGLSPMRLADVARYAARLQEPAHTNVVLHRFALVTCIVLFAATASADTHVAIDVTRNGDAFEVNATLFAPVPLDVAWDVLTDFESMEEFVPNVSASRIVATDGNRLTIEQQGRARFGLFSFGFDSVRRVELTPRTQIRSTQLKGNMRRMESVTTFTPADGGTRLRYQVDVVPGALFPAALTERFMEHEIEEQFGAIVKEMVRRAGLKTRPPVNG